MEGARANGDNWASEQHLAVAVNDGEGEGFDVFLNLREGLGWGVRGLDPGIGCTSASSKPRPIRRFTSYLRQRQALAKSNAILARESRAGATAASGRFTEYSWGSCALGSWQLDQ